MMTIPDRLSPLMAKLEAGEQITDADLRRTQMLQRLDVVKMGQDFVSECQEREQAAIQHMQDVHDASAKELSS